MSPISRDLPNRHNKIANIKNIVNRNASRDKDQIAIFGDPLHYPSTVTPNRIHVKFTCAAPGLA